MQLKYFWVSVWAPDGSGMCVHSLPMKTTKGLAHDVFVVLLPHILLVCDLTDTHWAQHGSIHGSVFWCILKVSVLTNSSRKPQMKYWGSVDKACCVSLIHFPVNVGCCTCIHSHDSIGLQVYCMDRPVRGICLLLSNQYFKEARANSVELADREGTGKDCVSLDNLFRQLGFRIITKVNLSAQVRRFDNFH